MIGGYQANDEVLDSDAAWPETRAAVAAFDRRCAGCHHDQQCPLPRSLSDENGLSFWAPDMNDPRLRRSRHLVFNLSRPEKSLVLLAPLARAAGGYEICRRPPTVTDHGTALSVAGTRRVPSALTGGDSRRHTACACYIPDPER